LTIPFDGDIQSLLKMGTKTDQKIIFISHIHEEASLAMVFKEWIETTFLGQCEVFVSSDNDDIPAGSQWLVEVEKSLQSAVGLIVLCSNTSLSRPWINFETGCGWIKKVPVIPICHSGLKKANLPRPFSEFQALELDDTTFIEKLFASLSKHLGYAKTPRINNGAMKQELDEALGKIMPSTSIPKLKLQPSDENELQNEAIEILKLLSGLPSDSSVTSVELARHFSRNEQRIKYFIDVLAGKKLITILRSISKPSSYILSAKGREYLYQKGLI